MKRSGVRPALLQGAVGLVVLALASHRSAEPTIWRYSARYLAFLVLAGGAGLLVCWLLANPRRWASWIGPGRDALRARLGPAVEAHWKVVALLGIALHLALVAVYLPPSSVFSTDPVLETDYAHHFHQVELAVQAFSSGRTWTYDPTFCAGYPEGTLFDVDVKLAEVTAFLITRLGVQLPLAYNLTILGAFASVPFLLLAFCRNFGLDRRTTLLVLYTGVLLWHAQPMLVLFNSSGMFGFVFAVYWALYTASVLHRCLERPGPGTLLWLLLALAVGFHAHILAPFLMVAPFAALYGRRFRTLPWKTHVLLAVAALGAVAANAWWIRNVVAFWDDRVATTFFPPKSLVELLETLIGMKELAPALAVLGLWGFLSSRRKNPALALAGSVSIAWYSVLTWLLVSVPFLRGLEPARFEIPCVVVAMIGTSLGIGAVLDGFEWPRVGLARAVPILLVVAVFAAQALGPRTPFENRFRDRPDDLAPLNDWIAASTSSAGRIAFMDRSPGYMTAARVACYNQRQFIGGPFSQLNMRHSHASFTEDRFLGQRLADLTGDEVASLLERYNIRWVVTTTDEGAATFRTLGPLVEPLESFVLREPGAGADSVEDSPFGQYRRPESHSPITTFRARGDWSWFLVGSGRLTAAPNRITVSDASPGGVVIKYHWVEPLRTSPSLPVRPYPVEGSPVGFVQVENGSVRNFTISPR
jgi:hypothetical protein